MTFHPVKRCYVRDPALRTIKSLIWYSIIGALLVAFGEWAMGRRG